MYSTRHPPTREGTGGVEDGGVGVVGVGREVCGGWPWLW